MSDGGGQSNGGFTTRTGVGSLQRRQTPMGGDQNPISAPSTATQQPAWAGAMAPQSAPATLTQSVQQGMNPLIQATPTASPSGNAVQKGLNPFLRGAPGEGPLMTAGLDAFNRNVRPIIEQQAQLQGLGQSPAVGVMTADALASVLPQFIMADYDNRFKAAGALQAQEGLGQSADALAADKRFRAASTLQGEEGLNQSAAQLAANIANQEQMRQLQAWQQAGQMQLGMGNLYNQSYATQLQQLQLALQAASAGGDLQRQAAQQALDAAQMEKLRLQGLAEAATSGIFGNVIPPTGVANTSGKTSGGGWFS